MATIYKVDCPNRKPLFEGVQGENEARSIQFDITAWVEELGAGAVTATAKRPTDAQPYPVTIEQGDGNIVTWKPTSTDTAFEGVGSFQLEYTVDDVLAKTCIWSTQIAPSLDPAGDPPDPYDNWLASMREVAAAAQQSANDSAASAQQAAGEVTNAQTEVKNAEAWAVGTKGGVDVPSTDETYHNNAKYWAEKSNENQYGAYITKSASGSIASFADGGDGIPMKSLKVAIVPKQAGSGDPSPSNVRPITGWTDADVHVQSNLFDVFTWGQNAINQRFYSVDNDGKITVNANDTSSVGARLFRFKPNAVLKVVFSGFSEVRAFGSSSESLGVNRLVVPSDGLVAIKFMANSYPTTGWAMIVPYESTVTEYEPYNGHTTPVPLGQTVYGGEVNPISGELVIDRAMVQVTSAMISGASAYEYSGKNGVSFTAFPVNVTKYDGGTKGLASVSTVKSGSVAKDQYMWFGSANGNKVVYWIGILDALNMTLSEWKTWAGEQSIQLIYPLATPTTVQLTPTQVASLLGTNNVWSDAGDVEVEYRADPTLAYAELQALILENN